MSASKQDVFIKYIRKPVYESAQRILHWWLAFTTILLIIVGFISDNLNPGAERAFMISWHIWLGKALVVGFIGRIFWGFFGPHNAQFASLFYPKSWLNALKTRKMEGIGTSFGHHPQASLSYLGFYFLTLVMIISGLLLAGILHGDGFLFERFLDQFKNIDLILNIHQYTWWAICGFIVVHISALIYHEWHEKVPVSQSILSGFQYRTIKEESDVDKI